MAFVGRVSKSLVVKYMAQMAVALRAGHLGSEHTKREVSMEIDCTRYGFKECRPSTATIELGFALVEGVSTSRTVINSLPERMVIFSSEGTLC